VFRFDDAAKARAASEGGALTRAPIAAVALTLLRDPLGFRAPVGCERAADIDLPAGELSFFPAPDESLVAVRLDQLAWHDGLPGV
jgi:hypothetical protein